MKWLLTPLLWLLAVVVAVAILYRAWRGRPVVLRGRYTPAFLRLVVIVLVTLGFGLEREPVRSVAAPVPTSDAEAEDLPSGVTAAVVEKWLAYQEPQSAWRQLKRFAL